MLKQELAKVQSEKEEVIAADSTEDYQKAADLKTRDILLMLLYQLIEFLHLIMQVLIYLQHS